MEYSALSDLWEPPVSKEEVTEFDNANPARANYLYKLGACVGGLHLQNLLPDSSESNFILSADGMKLIDLGGMRQGNREADYGKNILPFLLGFTRAEWAIFKFGYASVPHSHAHQVIRYIEEGERQPWIRSIAEERYDDARAQLDEYLRGSNLSVSEKIRALVELAFCHTSQGDHDQSVKVNREVLDLGKREGLDEVELAPINFNLGWAAFRLGDAATSEQGFLSVLASIEDAAAAPKIVLQALWCLCEIAKVEGWKDKHKEYSQKLSRARKLIAKRGYAARLILQPLEGGRFQPRRLSNNTRIQ